MLQTTLFAAAAFAALGDGDGKAGDDVPAIRFAAPVQVLAGGEKLRTEAPGYASPAWYDVDGDGREDLVVGQFAGGKMNVFRRLEDGTFAAGEWLQAGGETAEVPGVW